ncbi:MAG: hypothetical protein LC652_04545 [Halomonas sp.]|nr:hypothetical protein [Halomonas sp.]
MMLRLVVFLSLLAVLLVALDWQQRWRAQKLIENQSGIDDCRIESPCTLWSVQADICSVFSNNRSFLGRPFLMELEFKPHSKCGRGGRYHLDYWVRNPA